jgi:hypothetical protein
MNSMTPDICLSSILPFVRTSLKGRGNFSFENFVEGLWGELEKVGTPGIAKTSPLQGYTGSSYNFNSADGRLQQVATEAFYYLFHGGFIVPQLSNFPSHAHINRYALTPKGLSWTNGVEPLPEDVDGYMGLLHRLIPKLDSVIDQYIREGLSSFERRMFFAGTVMIGAASEKAIYLLADDLLKALKDGPRKEKLAKVMERRRLWELLDLVRELINRAIKSKILPYSVTEGAEAHLMSLFEAIRVQRNDAIHPMNATVSDDSVRLSFLAFPHALQMVEGLRKWFQANPNAISL